MTLARNVNGKFVLLSPEEEAAVRAEWAASDAAVTALADTNAAEAIRGAAIRQDAGRSDLLNRLKTATPAQIDTWIDTNVTTLPAARTVLKAILKVIALDGRS